MKDTIRKEYLRKTRKLLETKFSNRNLIKGINTWAVPLVRYSEPKKKIQHTKTVLFQAIRFSISTQIKCQE